jgi:hypothetical protein
MLPNTTNIGGNSSINIPVETGPRLKFGAFGREFILNFGAFGGTINLNCGTIKLEPLQRVTMSHSNHIELQN